MTVAAAAVPPRAGPVPVARRGRKCRVPVPPLAVTVTSESHGHSHKFKLAAARLTASGGPGLGRNMTVIRQASGMNSVRGVMIIIIISDRVTVTQ